MKPDIYPIEENRTNDATLERKLRAKINEWAAETPNHPFQNLGDLIEVRKITYCPSYVVELVSQYESRTKGKDTKPYINEKIPKRTFRELNEFNVWQFNYPELSQFTNETKRYYVDGSQYVADCTNCGASGSITCVTCKGTKQVSCSTCNGHKKITCSSCKGKGHKSCAECGGKGSKTSYETRTKRIFVPQDGGSHFDTQYQRYGYYREESYQESVQKTCRHCNGHGTAPCATCNSRGELICPTCKGQGNVTCSSCNGSGKNTCPSCKGHKQLMQYFYVDRIMNSKVQGCTSHHPLVESKFPRFVGNETITDAGINCKHAHGKKLEMNLIADANKLNEIANSYIEQSQNNFSPDKQLLFQELDVARIDCWVVAYAFRGKDYWMLSYGANYELVTGESPLSEIVEDFWVKAYKAANVYNYFGSLLMYKKAYAMKSADLGTSISESVIELEEKMQEPYDFGVTFGMLLALLFGSFGVYTYFSEVNYVLGYVDFINKPSSFLYAYQAWAMVLVYWGFCGLSSVVARKIFEGKMQFVPVAALRFGIGIAVVFGISVLSFVILAALNALGIGILASFVVWAFVKLLWLVKFIVVLIIAIVIWIFDIIATVISWF